MLRFEMEMDVAATDLRERTIEGLLVPYGEVGQIQGTKYRFQPRSIELARARTPLFVDHDRTRPVGVLAELVDTERGPIGRFAIDPTPDGDTALVQAASGSRGSLSIGAEVVEADKGADGVVDVTLARVLEVSTLAIGAFAGAGVLRVAAEHDPAEPEPAEPPAEPEQPELEPEPETEAPAPPAEREAPMDRPLEAAADPAPVIIAERTPAPSDLAAGELVRLIVRAQHGERDALRYLEAALAESISTDVSGLLPPTYERTVLGGKTTPRPLYSAFKSRPLPGVGLNVNKPVWTTPPDGQWAATVDDDAHSTKVVVGSQTATVQRWDWAGAIPWVVVQRSDPSIVDEIYAAAVEDFYFDVEAKVYAELSAANAGVATSLGAAIAEFQAEAKRTPEVIIMAGDVWGKFADTGALANSVGAGGVSASGDLTTSFAGIPAETSGALAAGELFLSTRRAVDARVTDPVRLTANAIGALNVELAVVGEGLFDTDWPDELMKFAAVVPPAGRAAGPEPAAPTRRSSH